MCDNFITIPDFAVVCIKQQLDTGTYIVNLASYMVVRILKQEQLKDTAYFIDTYNSVQCYTL